MNTSLREILRAAELLFAPGDVVELRVPKAGKQRTISGYFNDFAKLANAALALERSKYPGLYWTLNPVLPDLLARAANNAKPFVLDTTKDEHIVSRRWFIVDADPKRPTGISSTDAEKAAGLEVTQRIRQALAELGWPAPIFADSGNGGHLLYRIDLPNDDASRDLLQRCLDALLAQFGTPQVDIDRTMFNASRIAKMYGTWARKGDDTPDRPHRISQLLAVPDTRDIVPVELLRALAAKAPAPPRPVQAQSPSRPHGTPGPRQFTVEEFLSKYGIAYRPPQSWNGGRKWVLLECPFDASHKAPDSMVYEAADGALGFKCLHNSCHDYHWQEFREKFEPLAQRMARNATNGRSAPVMSPPPPASDYPDPSDRDVPGQNPPSPPAAGEEDGEPPQDLLPYPLTDSGNGQRIAAMFGNTVRFCVEMDSWLLWDGRRWAVDRTNAMRHKAMEMARELYRQALRLEGAEQKQVSKHALASESSRGITNALTEAKRMPGIAISAQDLDQRPELLNFVNGTVNLRTGSMFSHDRTQLLTKLCEHRYNPEAKCPKFIGFVEWAMGGPIDANPDAELSETTIRLVAFLQRVIGYSITGDVSEKCVFVFYGADGDNGKTTLLTLFRELLGRDYASLLLIETIMHARSTDNTAREDMADLRGARFVQTSEISKEDRLNEQRVKFLTQGMGTIKSRRLHEHLIEFTATHKLLMDCNYRPKVTGQDNAIWRRLIQVPFTQTVPEGKKDLKLREKLYAEAEGILAWAIRGAIEWYECGLGKPEEVQEAQQDWREHDDPIREFLADWCNVEPELFCTVADLMSAYLHWAKEYGEKFPLPRRSFNEALVGKGIRQDRKHFGRIWVGVELKSEIVRKLRGDSDERIIPGKTRID